jgi:hypothetical protein
MVFGSLANFQCDGSTLLYRRSAAVDVGRAGPLNTYVGTTNRATQASNGEAITNVFSEGQQRVAADR